MSRNKFDDFYFKKSISELIEKLRSHRITGNTMDNEWYEALKTHLKVRRELSENERKIN